MMTERRYPYHIVDVFTTARLQGNPLAVFTSADGISDAEMRRIAGELNLSETVFFLSPRSAGAAVKVRIFTPRRELDFAGHPTIGSAYVLSRLREIPERFGIEENVGIVPLEYDTDADGNRRFWLTTPHISFFQTLEPAFCAKLLGLRPEDIDGAVLPQFLSAGSPLLFVCIKNVDAVDRAELQTACLPEAIGEVDSVGTFIYARKEPKSESCFEVYSRMFAPQTGIAEDPATGGATGPLAAHMLSYGLLPKHDVEFISEQGVKIGRRSLLQVRVENTGGDEPVIRVGGSVVAVAEGTFTLD